MANETKTRSDLRQYFIKNAIPTEGNFADLIDAQLNQADDGLFKQADQPLSLVASGSGERRALQLYREYPANNPDWLLSLNPKLPGGQTGTTAGFGLADGSGNTRLLLDAQGNLTVTGDVRYAGRLSKLDVAEADDAHIRARDLRFGHSTRRGTLATSPALGRALVDGTDSLVLNYDGDWSKVDIQSPVTVRGDLTSTGALNVDGSATVGTLTARGSGAQVLTIVGTDHGYMAWYLQGSEDRKGWIGYGSADTPELLTLRNQIGPVSINGATFDPDGNFDGTLSKLDVAEADSATIRANDLLLGSRRSVPGRALVDFTTESTDSLVLNYGKDWSKVDIQSPVTVGTLTARGNAGVLNIVGNNHAYMQWFPEGEGQDMRKGWIGYGSANTSRLTIENEGNDVVISFGGGNRWVFRSSGKLVQKRQGKTDNSFGGDW